ncbi:UNVERIFIED_ORG: hypothetical protein ABIB52_002984 [Arthrobacter sp. UYCu721]
MIDDGGLGTPNLPSRRTSASLPPYSSRTGTSASPVYGPTITGSAETSISSRWMPICTS